MIICLSWFVWLVFKDTTNGEQPSGREAENRAGATKAERRVAVKDFRVHLGKLRDLSG
jgi:hypothetical protein